MLQCRPYYEHYMTSTDGDFINTMRGNLFEQLVEHNTKTCC